MMHRARSTANYGRGSHAFSSWVNTGEAAVFPVSGRKIDHFRSDSCEFFDFSGRKNVKSILSRKNLRAAQFLTFIFV
jgi:hypothetical protein